MTAGREQNKVSEVVAPWRRDTRPSAARHIGSANIAQVPRSSLNGFPRDDKMKNEPHCRPNGLRYGFRSTVSKTGMLVGVGQADHAALIKVAAQDLQPDGQAA